MSYKSIAVFLDNSARCKERLEYALHLAQMQRAHLTGIHLVYEPIYPLVPEAGVEQLFAQYEEETDQVRRQAEQAFCELARKADVAYDWRVLTGRQIDVVPLHIRTVDLAIVGQRDPDDEATFVAEGFPELVALEGGRPTLFVPFAGPLPNTFKRILVGWDGGREAARAMADALPFLSQADEVTVMSVQSNSEPPREFKTLPGVDVAAYLSRHGIKAEFVRSTGVKIGAGEWLLSQAADLGADLLVTGLYGHSRMREFILGGVTRTLLRQMPVPVLMSH